MKLHKEKDPLTKQPAHPGESATQKQQKLWHYQEHTAFSAPVRLLCADYIHNAEAAGMVEK